MRRCGRAGRRSPLKICRLSYSPKKRWLRPVRRSPPSTTICRCSKNSNVAIFHVLKVVGGNRTRAAEVMGIDRRTLYRMAERFGVKDELAEKGETEG